MKTIDFRKTPQHGTPMTSCDTCLTILQAGFRSARRKEEWLREYDFHLALAHGARPTASVTIPATREQSREAWRMTRIREKPRAKERGKPV